MPVSILDLGAAPGNEMAVSAVLAPTRWFDFRRSLDSLKSSGATDPLDTLDENLTWLERPVQLAGRPFLVRLTNLNPGDEYARIGMTIWADDTAETAPNEETVKQAAEWANRRFLMDVDMEEVREALSVDEYGQELCARFWPARATNLSTPWEALLKTVISNQIFPGLAVRLQQGLLSFYGSTARINGQEYRFFPTVQRLAEIIPDDLLGMKFSRQKAGYLPGIGQMIEATPEKFDFERLRGLPAEEAVAILDELPGVGPWTAHYVAMRGLPHLDVFIPEDGLFKTLAASFGRGPTLTGDEFERITRVYSPYRTFACYYSYMKLFNA